MNINQINYAKAKALYDTVLQQYLEETKPLSTAVKYEKLTMEEWYIQTGAISARLNLYKLSDLRYEAEEALLKWARELVETHYPHKFGELTPVWDHAHLLSVRNKLINLCMRMGE
jgi:hypothetical protein